MNKFCAVFLMICTGLAHGQEARSMYLVPEGFPPKGTLLSLTTEEAKAESDSWRKLMALKNKKLMGAFRAESYLEYDLRAIGGVYSYYVGKTYFNYMQKVLSDNLLMNEEYTDISCNYFASSETLVIEQCVLPTRQKKAQSYGVETVPPTYTYSEIQKDSNGIFSVKNKIYIKAKTETIQVPQFFK